MGNRSRWLEQVAEEAVTQTNNSQRFNLERTVKDAAYQQQKLNKDKAKVVKLTARITERKEEIKAMQDLETNFAG